MKNVIVSLALSLLSVLFIQETTQAQNFQLAPNGVTVICPDAAIGDTGEVNGITYTKRTKDQITTGNAATTCTSGITDLSGLFYEESSFNDDISSWDVSSVTDMQYLFEEAFTFNQDLSYWNVSNVVNMRGMFYDAASFNEDISGWDVSKVTNMTEMFWGARQFNQNIGNWDVSAVISMLLMFYDARTFNQDIGNWDVSNVTSMQNMFQFATLFNQNLSGWCVDGISSLPTNFAAGSALTPENLPVWGTCPNTNFSLAANGITILCPDAAVGETGEVNGIMYTKRTRDQIIAFPYIAPTACTSGITDMSEMFRYVAGFNEDISTWDVSNVTDMGYMFYSANSFNMDIRNWDVSNVTDMGSMFGGATAFNRIISGWDVSNVTDMGFMFGGASAFNREINGWNVSNVVTMQGMFAGATSFNGIIRDWDVSNVMNMAEMFHFATSFRGNISNWDVSSVTNMAGMFTSANSFNGNISDWDVSGVTDMGFMFRDAGSFNQDLSGWCVELITTVPDEFSYFSALAPENQPIWGTCPNPNFSLAANGVTVVCTDAAVGESGPLNGVTYTKRTREQIIADRSLAPTSCTSGITDMSEMFFNIGSFNEDISTWDVSSVTTMELLFANASSFNNDISLWDVSSVTTMQSMFGNAVNFNRDLSSWTVSSVANMMTMFVGATSFNGDISDWDVSSVTTMQNMFAEASSFNGDISNWDVSGVTIMSGLFAEAVNFNGDISNWDVSGVTNMRFMFYNANSFNGNIRGWYVNSVTNMDSMFQDATSFNQDLSGWCVELIASEPDDFALNSALTIEHYPVWGTCTTTFFLADNGITIICSDADFGESGVIDGVIFTKRTRDQITTGNASTTCTSGITDMANLFQNTTTFDENISTWDVSSVSTMEFMFWEAHSFNSDISLWDVSSVQNMFVMFNGARSFNADIGEWDVSNVTNMGWMFANTNSFNSDISNWDVSNVTNMSIMFYNAESFNADISEWDVSNVTDMELMFGSASTFNGDISSWDVSSATKMNFMFWNATSFNQNLSNWCVELIPTEPTFFATNSGLAPENFPLWGTCPVVVTSSLAGNNEGWRILGAPVTNATYGELLSGLWTQGFPGASFEDGASNVYWYDETTRQFNQPANATNIIGSSSNDGFNNVGRGFITYVYEDDFNDGTSTEWPKAIDIFGLPHSGEIITTYSATILPENDAQGWHLASNPYPFPINWTALVADGALEDMISAIFVYDANANDGVGGYRVHYGFEMPNLPESIAYDGIIAPFQGFWVRTAGIAASGSITFRESYETTGGTLLDEPEVPDFFAFSIEGESLEASAVLLLDEGASLSTSKPVPFSAEMIRFGFMREGNLQPDVFRSTEAVDGDQLIIPLDFAAVHSGTYTLNLNGSGLSEIESTVILRDHLSGAEHHLSPDNPYTFIYDAQQELASNKEDFNPKTALVDSKSLLLESEHRFELHIQFGNATSTEPFSELPTVVALNQNYPNPFNPTTQIQYALPESGNVRLDVYNVMGQRVATLVNDQKPAGYHTVRFDASRLASGTYLYRLQMGNHAITKKLLLIK